jgi:hypothetical protein
MTEIGVVLDTAALIAYARGNARVGELLVNLADNGERYVVPSTCLASAYRDAPTGGEDLLDLIANQPLAVVVPLEHEHCAVAGGWARVLGLDTAHAAIEAASTDAVVPLMTDKRDLVTQFLAKEWPIIDI